MTQKRTGCTGQQGGGKRGGKEEGEEANRARARLRISLSQGSGEQAKGACQEEERQQGGGR